MVTASDIVNLLLERDGLGPTGVPSSVVLFGKHMPPEGAVFNDLNHMLTTLQQNGLVRTLQGSNTIDELLRQGYTIIEKKDPRDFVVYSARLPLKLTPDAAQMIQQHLGITDETQMLHKKSATGGGGQPVAGESVLFGSNELEKQKLEREKAAGEQKAAPAQPQAKAKELISYNDFSGRPQEPFDPEKEEFTPRPQPTVGKVTQAPVARGTLGFTYDGSYEVRAMNEQEKGCMVAAVHDGGPLALAGVRAGDLIQTATYVGDDGQQKEWRIRGQKNMAAALTAANPSYPMILHIRRGSQQLNVVVEVKPNAPSGSLHIPAAEVQQYAKEQEVKEQQPAATAQAQAPASRQRPTTQQRQMPLRGLPRGPRPQKTFKFAPNEPQPTSQTGNLPPNVSTLT